MDAQRTYRRNRHIVKPRFDLKVGDRVRRGPDWDWPSFDEYEGIRGGGTVKEIIRNGWVEVEWDSGKYDCYRFGAGGGAVDIVPETQGLSERHASAVRAAVEATSHVSVLSRVSLPDGRTGTVIACVRNVLLPIAVVSLDIPKEAGDDDPHVPISVLRVLRGPLVVGDRVRRGADWIYKDEDFDEAGVPCTGTLIEIGNGSALVRWDNARCEYYRIGNWVVELIPADVPNVPFMRSSQTNS